MHRRMAQPCLIQAFFADASFGAPAIVFYLHLAMITILWRETCEIRTVDIEVQPVETQA